MQKKVKRPWNPQWLIVISIFCSFLVAGIVAGFNYGRLDMPDKKRKTILWSIIGFIIAIMITRNIENILSFTLLINTLVGAYLAHIQLKYYVAWKAEHKSI